MKILSFGAGMQSTALALMSCENVRVPNKFPLVPVYDAVIFCDLGKEPPWVLEQVEFTRKACIEANIPFYVLNTPLYMDYIKKYGEKRTSTIPFWSIDENGKKGKMQRHCTIDYKINTIAKFVRWNLLGYKKGQRLKKEDIGAHEMHIGFSKEEANRVKIYKKPNPMFVKKYPLIDMGLERKDNYAYIRDVWGLKTKASACSFCPFHQNYFFHYMKKNYPFEWLDIVEFDDMLEEKRSGTKIKSKIYISKSRKRIKDLTDDDCKDMQSFLYKGEKIWNGF